VRRGWRSKLHSVLAAQGSVNLVGVGNPIRSDDGVGLAIVSQLRSKLGHHPVGRVTIHGPSFMPERILSKVASEGGTVLIFDAVEATRNAGAVICGALRDTKYGYFATHNIPLRLVPGLAERADCVYVVGVQPGSLEVGEGLTPAVSASANLVVNAVAEEVRAGA
jgi:hydrogenase maturation protease